MSQRVASASIGWARRDLRGRRRTLRAVAKATGYWTVRHHHWLAAAAFAWALADGAFAHAPAFGLSHFVALAALLGLLLLRIAARFQSPATADATPRPEASRREDLALGLLLVVTIHVLVQMTGGTASRLHGLTYLFATFAASFAEPVAMGVIVLALLAGEGLSAFAGGLTPDLSATASVNGVYVLLFSGCSWVFLKAQREFQTRHHQRAVKEQLERTLEEARDFRLVASPLTRESRTRPREEEERVQLREAVEGIRRTVRSALHVLRDAYGLHTCSLYWLDDAGLLRLREAVSGSNVFEPRSLHPKEGLPGAAFASSAPVRTHGLKADDGRVPYYLPGEHVFALLAVPVRQARRVRGVLIGDRRTSLPFSESNEQAFVQVAALIADAVDNERVFIETERAKDAQERFHRAVKALNSAQAPGDAHVATLNAVREIAAYDFAALTALDPDDGVHRVVHAEGPGASAIAGLTFADNQGLVSQVTRTNHYLPITARVGDRRPVVFTPEVGPADMQSLLVLPLAFGAEVVATLTLAAEALDAYPLEIRARIEVVTSAAATSLVNARNFEKVQALATIDPLTRLANRRAFAERFEGTLARARRSGRPVSLIVADLDRFKHINDTYGHYAGDEVLRQAARCLESCVRETDVVARYGGEEFAVLLEEADVDGGRQMAERIRAAVEDLTIETEGSVITPTLSAGCATWESTGPDVGAERLVEHADQALYRAKQLGRNRTVHFRDMGGRR